MLSLGFSNQLSEMLMIYSTYGKEYQKRLRIISQSTHGKPQQKIILTYITFGTFSESENVPPG